ncbi:MULTISPECIES: ThiF family adenylyltransferase [unclassified Streptomyces]|uniref:ThiF family adenylyltransferase n=1 Tax=unclassified Streptomyces TaxID=2593676 RepID=UPI002E2E12D1|nr:ThiF family adenylyltransferase [Streptomyces sp. NBC_00223]
MNTPQDADAYYRDLTERNRGLIPDGVQQRLRAARVLVAGCGSTGGAAIEPLARLGVGRFTLTEPGEYELNNLNRQSATRHDIGRNKAEVGAERVLAIHPFAEVSVDTAGIQVDNAALLLDGVDVVVDGVDVTTVKGWQAKFTLHTEAARLGVPVVSGYDMSGTQHVRYYDYRVPLEPLAGEVTEQNLADETLWALLLRVIPREIVPADLIADVTAHRDEPEYSVPQLVYASHLFGVVAARYVVEILAGNPVRDAVTVDVHSLVSLVTPQG